jgi:predicted transcriptional regulator
MVNKDKPNRNTDIPVLAHALYRGLYSRVAARLRVSRAAVSQVASGKKKSRRIEKALLSEARRIERAIHKGRDGKEAA